MELLVHTAPIEMSGADAIDRHRPDRGCVLEMRPDGATWTQAERSHPTWRIVRLPGVPWQLLSQFTAADPGYGDADSERITAGLRRWRSVMDLDALDATLADPSALDSLENDPAQALAIVLGLLRDREMKRLNLPPQVKVIG